jgi:hypothetical protein
MSDTPTRAVGRWLSPVAVALATGLLALGYAVDGPEPWAAFVAPVPAVLWVTGRVHRSAPAVDASLAAFLALAGLGMWLGVSAGWMVPAAVSGLAAWDLAHLERRLTQAGHVENRDLLAARHLAHLLPVLVLGLALALVGAGVRLDLGFFPALLLGVLAIAGLALLVTYLRRDE